jgi:hypothetical protein
MTLASRPAIRKNARPATTYMIPETLVVDGDDPLVESREQAGRSRSASRAEIGGATTLMVGVS